jgi:hypothetical protein
VRETKRYVDRILKECEKSAQRILKSQGNPPDNEVTDALSPQAARCHQLKRLVAEIRSEVKEKKSSSIALASFRAGQLALQIMLVHQHAPQDILLAHRVVEGGSTGGARARAKRALRPEKLAAIVRDYKNLQKNAIKLSFTSASIWLARKHECSARTVRRYLRKRMTQKAGQKGVLAHRF